MKLHICVGDMNYNDWMFFNMFRGITYIETCLEEETLYEMIIMELQVRIQIL